MTSEISPDISQFSSCISRAEGKKNTARAGNDWPYFTI